MFHLLESRWPTNAVSLLRTGGKTFSFCVVRSLLETRYLCRMFVLQLRYRIRLLLLESRSLGFKLRIGLLKRETLATRFRRFFFGCEVCRLQRLKESLNLQNDCRSLGVFNPRNELGYESSDLRNNFEAGHGDNDAL